MSKKNEPRIAKIWLIRAHYRKDVEPCVYYVKHYSEREAKQHILDQMPYMKIYGIEEFDGVPPWTWPFNFWIPNVEGGKEFRTLVDYFNEMGFPHP